MVFDQRASACIRAVESGPPEMAASTTPAVRSAKRRSKAAASSGATLSGRGRLMMLVGEPGIGKTRTADEFATYARLRSAQVLWGRCYDGEGAPAHWPWVQIIRAYVHDREPQSLLTEMRID